MAFGTVLARQAARVASFFAIVILTPALSPAITPTTTALAITPSGSISEGTVITLTASVAANGSPVSRGLILFCNAAALHCDDSAVLGQAQLTSGGAARIKLRLGIGSHKINAVFRGTVSFARSLSAVEDLTVTGTVATTTTVSGTGVPGAFTLSGTVAAFGSGIPEGSISFAETGNNSSLGSVALGASNVTHSFSLKSAPAVGDADNIAPGDFNNDGKPDIVVANRFTSEVTFLKGNGDGTLTPIPGSTATGETPMAIIAGDFNSDGNLDVGTPNVNANTISILLGNGDGTFTLKSSPSVDAPGQIFTGDFNGDGIPDLISVSGGDTAITILLGKGDGTFTAMPPVAPGAPAPGAYLSILVADFNGDGLDDLALEFPDFYLVGILLSNGDGTFTAQPYLQVIGAGRMATGDFNGDGRTDIALALNYYDYSSNMYVDTITALLGNGDGTLTATGTSVAAGLYPGTIVVGDFNGDGVSDLVAADENAEAIFYSGIGDGSFTRITTLSTAPYGIQSIGAADFNGDGATDLMIGTGNNSADIYLSQVVSTGAIVSALGTGSYEIVASYSGDTLYSPSSSQPLPITVSVPPPVFVPKPGTYQWTQQVTLTDAAPGAVIYYTLDGTNPTPSSTVYTAPIVVSWDATINAMATLSGKVSAVTTGVYSIDRPLPEPTFSLAPGTYPSPQTVALSVDPAYCSHAVCDIYYTLNGTTPTTSSTKYTKPITLSSVGTITIEAFATSHHFVASSVVVATYTLQ